MRALHAASPRADRPFVPVNCGAIPAIFWKANFSAMKRGAFTHALRSRPGRFELADGGTLFLDEIGEMEPGLQVKILRVLQEKEIERVGGTGCRKVDVRIVAAPNRDPEAAVAAGTFREDLYYRLNVIPIHLPPLRERGRDVLLLARHFLGRFCRKKERPPLELSPLVQRILLAYAWPGNVRELENVMERLSVLVDGHIVAPEDLPARLLQSVGDIALLPEVDEYAPEADVLPGSGNGEPAAAVEAPSRGFAWPDLQTLAAQGMGLKEFLDAVEMHLIEEALQRTDGVKNQAAELLGIKRTTLIEKLKKKACSRQGRRLLTAGPARRFACPCGRRRLS